MKNDRKHDGRLLDLKEYYDELLAREKAPPIDLVSAWTMEDMRAVMADFRMAVSGCNFSRTRLNVGAMSPQAIGNAIASFVSSRLNKHLELFTLEACPGPGFPDFRLVRLSDNKAFVLELKTTARHRNNDSRVVLTSTSQKLRTLFAVPVCHLVATAHYALREGVVHIKRFRLNFLAPGTPVNVRLEVSVTPRLLSKDAVWMDGKGSK